MLDANADVLDANADVLDAWLDLLDANADVLDAWLESADAEADVLDAWLESADPAPRGDRGDRGGGGRGAEGASVSPSTAGGAILAAMSPSGSPEVDVLAADAGLWRATVEVRPMPDGVVQKSEGTMSGRMCGPWLVTDFKNETSGFEGHGIYGWDSVGQKYVATWVDPMRRALVVMEGAWDESARTLTFIGEMSRPDGSRVNWREVTERPEKDVRVFRSFVPSPLGGEFEAMTVRYERAA